MSGTRRSRKPPQAPRCSPVIQRASGPARKGTAIDDLDTAQGIVDDLADRRGTGKTLGKRTVSGDLTGLARIRFDDAAHRLGLRTASPAVVQHQSCDRQADGRRR